MTVTSATSSSGSASALADPSRIEAAHATVRADRTIQFDFPIEPPRQPTPMPDWLRSMLRGIGDFIQWVGPGWSWLLYALLAALVVAIVVALVPSLRSAVVQWWTRRRADAPAAEPEWSPGERAARALLDEADALAAAGRFDEAVRLILHRSIEDIEAWRGKHLAPSLTSRDIVAVERLPETARGVFSGLVAMVERSLFARRPLSASDWTDARGAYAGFALGR